MQDDKTKAVPQPKIVFDLKMPPYAYREDGFGTSKPVGDAKGASPKVPNLLANLGR